MFSDCIVFPNSKKIKLGSSNQDAFTSAGKNMRIVLVPSCACVSLQLFPMVWIFLRFLGNICYNRRVLSGGHKNYFKDWCLVNSQPTFMFLTYSQLNELWPYYQKDVNQTTLNHTSL